MKPIKKILYPIYLPYCYLTFIAGLLVVFPFVLIATMLGQPVAGNLVVKLSRAWSDSWIFLIGVRHKNIVESPIDKNRHYVFVANHISYIDIPLIFQGIRKNSFRVLGKKEMGKIPVFGTLYKLAVVLIDRSNPQSRANSIKELQKVLDQNISIFIFPEGTFNETGQPLKSFYDGAFRLAIEMQTPVKPIVFLDAVKRMHHKSIFSITPGKSRAVHLPEIPVEGLTMNDVASLKKTTFDLMEECIKKYGGHYQ
ncbi:MAG: 1-acyl-sn-glycerol-3-phosphate acyltransferase [Chitinophagaceae bacterium]|nr:1-acyl-sn-glycerol-3-phosphate acyltransferase [Chitinophagaceae bacterium]